jgi:hypothetical protein
MVQNFKGGGLIRTDKYETAILAAPSDNLETVVDPRDEADISLSDGDEISDNVFEIDHIPNDNFEAPKSISDMGKDI